MRASPTALLESKVSIISAISVSVIWKYESELLVLGIKLVSEAFESSTVESDAKWSFKQLDFSWSVKLY